MEVVKNVNNPYDTKIAMRNLIEYVAVGADYIGGYGISLAEINSIYNEFEEIKRIWRKNEEGRRQVRHIIVSFEEDDISEEEGKQIAWMLAGYYGVRFQVFYGIHNNTRNQHIHFVINTVSFIDGKMYSEGYSDLMKYKLFVEETVNKIKSKRITYCGKRQ